MANFDPATFGLLARTMASGAPAGGLLDFLRDPSLLAAMPLTSESQGPNREMSCPPRSRIRRKLPERGLKSVSWPRASFNATVASVPTPMSRIKAVRASLPAADGSSVRARPASSSCEAKKRGARQQKEAGGE